MTGFTDKLETFKDKFGKHGKSSSEHHTSTASPVHPTFLPSESAAQPQVRGGHGSQGHTGIPAAPHAQAPPSYMPTSGGASDTESYEHVSAPKDFQPTTVTAGQVTPSGPITPQLSSPRLPRESLPSHPTSQPTAGAQAPSSFQYEDSPTSGISADTSSKLAASNTAPGGPTFEPRAQEEQRTLASGISPDVSTRLAGSTGGSTFQPGTEEHGGPSQGQQRAAAASPNVTDVGVSPSIGRPGENRSLEADRASIGGGGVNASTTPTNTSSTGLSSGQPQGYVQQAQETAAPYVAKVQETAGPYVARAQETMGPYVAAAQEAASPYVAKALDLSSSAIESTRPVIAQAATSAGNAAGSAYNTATAELDARGVNMENTKQRLADAGQAAKDYGTVGQQRAGEYLQQAVDQAKNMDGENKSIVATIFGTVVLVWLAFGFSLMAMLALGVGASIAALLARFSSKRVSGNNVGASSGFATPPTHSQTTAAPMQTQVPGVETHYPQPSHPDNSLNNAAS